MWTLRAPGETSERAEPPLNRPARKRLADAVDQQLAAGFEVESGGERYAVLIKRRRLLGIAGARRKPTRIVVSLDPRGRPIVRPRHS
jgi:hypothetical protein